MIYSDQDLVQQNPDYYHKHFLAQVLLLLGAKEDVVKTVKDSLDRPLTENDVNIVRNYACDLVDEHKIRLRSLPSIKIQNE